MLRRLFRYAWRTLLALLLVLLAVPILLYVPAVQDFVRGEATRRLSRSLGMELSVERLRLRFPLRLAVEGTRLVNGTDTLVDCGALSLEVVPWPLVRKRVVVRSFALERLRAHYRDSLAGLDLRLAAGRFVLDGAEADLAAQHATVAGLLLADADVGLTTTPAVPVAASAPDSAAAIPWRLDVGRIGIERLTFGMRTAPDVSTLSVRLPAGEATDCRVRLDSQRVDVARVRLDEGAYAYLTAPIGVDSVAAQPAPEREESLSPAASAAMPWTVRAGSIILTDNRVEYGAMDHRPVEGFDPSFIALSSLDLALDSLYNRGADIALHLRRLAFVERSGLAVRDAHGRVAMDSARIRLADFRLETAASTLRADLSAGAGVLRMAPDAPLDADLALCLATKELNVLMPLPPVLDDRIAELELSAEGTLGDLRRIGLSFALPGHFGLEADGRAANLSDPAETVASLRFTGDLGSLDFLRELLPDTTLRRRLAIPDRMRLEGTAGADKGRFSLSTALTVAGGRLAVEGAFTPAAQRYEAAVRADSLPLGRFLPADSLGLADFALRAAGAGFDPLRPQTRAEVEARVDRAEFRGHDFGGVELTAGLEEGRLSGALSDRDEALRLALRFSGVLDEQEQRIGLKGNLHALDLAALGFAPEPLGGAFALDAEASASATGCYAARIALDSIALRTGGRTDSIRPTAVSLRIDSAALRVGMTSGDLSLAFAAPGPVDSLLAAATRSADSLVRQLEVRTLDMERLGAVLPAFDLRLEAGRENILDNFLRSRDLSFDALHVAGAKNDSLPLSLGVRTEGLSASGLVFDTVTLGLRQQGAALSYALRLANRPGNLDHVAEAAVSGRVEGRTGRIDLSQRNRAGREGFRLGLDARWSDSLVRVSVDPLDPVLAYDVWTANRDNYLVYRFDRHLEADLDMTHGAQRFALRSIPGAEGASGGIRVDLAGLNIGSVLALLPSAPPVDGVLGTTMTLEMAPDSLSVRGDLSVAELMYDKQRFGNVDFGLFYAQGRGHGVDARLALDSAEVLTLRGDYRETRESSLDLTVAIPGFPLQQANVFLPADLLRLSGVLHGGVHVGGTPARPALDGGLHFAGAELRVPMIGTAFRLPADTIRIDSSRVRLRNYALTAPNGRPLTIDGGADLSDPGRMTADVSLRAADFQFVDVPRKAGTSVYGKAYLDLDATARGPLDALVVRGNVALLGGTEIGYVMQDSPMEVKDRAQDVVTFVSFRELDGQRPADTVQTLRLGGLDLLVNVDVNRDVKAAVDLSADGSNRIDLQGGGNLTYAMNPLGDISLSGRYVLTGGTVRYNPPVISQKVFAIRPDGYVEWMGDAADPTFNITAVETVRANVSSDGEQSRPVNFDIAINIRNSLDDLAISFDLSAPEDLTMQNELNSLTAEQRANQAMNLLIYNTYTGPGTTAKVSSENPLNSFIQKELNQWAQNSLKGVDLSFGINSYGEDDPAGQHTDYSYRLSKSLFSNRVRAVIGGKFSPDADPSQNLKENLIDDISLEYMLTRRDNMFLRLFRHTGYESILEGEITETGVGFVIRKRLLRLGDLFKPVRPREKKKNEEKTNESDAH